MLVRHGRCSLILISSLAQWLSLVGYQLILVPCCFNVSLQVQPMGFVLVSEECHLLYQRHGLMLPCFRKYGVDLYLITQWLICGCTFVLLLWSLTKLAWIRWVCICKRKEYTSQKMSCYIDAFKIITLQGEATISVLSLTGQAVCFLLHVRQQ